MKFLIIFLTFYFYSIESFLLDCEFGHESDLGYACRAQNENLVTSKENREITKVQGQHIWGENDEVLFFYAYQKKVNYFPRGITKFFKNIENILINDGKLKEITKEDLKEFGEFF